MCQVAWLVLLSFVFVFSLYFFSRAIFVSSGESCTLEYKQKHQYLSCVCSEVQRWQRWYFVFHFQLHEKYFMWLIFWIVCIRMHIFCVVKAVTDYSTSLLTTKPPGKFRIHSFKMNMPEKKKRQKSFKVQVIFERLFKRIECEAFLYFSKYFTTF